VLGSKKSAAPVNWDEQARHGRVFDAVLKAAGIRVIRSAVQAPLMNSLMERWIAAAGVSCGTAP
jgi:hypothetical protein